MRELEENRDRNRLEVAALQDQPEAEKAEVVSKMP